jgi:hypothetical protein
MPAEEDRNLFTESQDELGLCLSDDPPKEPPGTRTISDPSSLGHRRTKVHLNGQGESLKRATVNIFNDLGVMLIEGFPFVLRVRQVALQTDVRLPTSATVFR